MSELIKKLQNQKAKPATDTQKPKLECNYKDNYYGDKACIPCSK